MMPDSLSHTHRANTQSKGSKIVTIIEYDQRVYEYLRLFLFLQLFRKFEIISKSKVEGGKKRWKGGRKERREVVSFHSRASRLLD